MSRIKIQIVLPAAFLLTCLASSTGYADLGRDPGLGPIRVIGPVIDPGALDQIISVKFPRPGAGSGPVNKNWQTRPIRKVSAIDPAVTPVGCAEVRKNFARAQELFDLIQSKARQLLHESGQLDVAGTDQRYSELRALREKLFLVYPDSYDTPDRRISLTWATPLASLEEQWKSFLLGLKVEFNEVRVTIGDRSFPVDAAFPPDFGTFSFQGEPLRIDYSRDASPVEDCLNSRTVEITGSLRVEASIFAKILPIQPPTPPDLWPAPIPSLKEVVGKYELHLLEPTTAP